MTGTEREARDVVRRWHETGRRTLVKTHVFELQERRTVNPRNDRELTFFVLEAGPWVNVIPLTEDGRVVMVRQYRQGTGAVTLEIPGGMAEPGETPDAGARRELLEETGYEAERLELLGVVDSNPAIQTNATYTFLATGLRKTADPHPDQAEDLEVVDVALDDVEGLIRDRRITHSLVIAAFYWLDRARRERLADRLERSFDQLARVQQDHLASLVKRINASLTLDDLLSPQDFPEIASDPDVAYQDGMLTGIETARAAFRAILKEP